jgi:bacillithiol biosynthesis deacetylase BshB1
MKLDVLAVGAHPDDVELGCGATVATLTRAGCAVGILHLTSGEAGTRGTGEGRRAEAEAAAAALGVSELAFLDCGDGALRTGPREEEEVIAVLRRYRPDIVLSPSPHDRHPDHGRAHRLVEAASFYSGLAGRARDLGPSPHRPGAVFSYMQHDGFDPSFVVDVTAGWEAKLEALRAYRSQLYSAPREGDEGGDGKSGEGGPVTKISTREFWLAVEGRARHFGLMINAELGEPFWSRGPLAVSDLLSILPGGLR